MPDPEERLRERIRAHGPVPFAEFMEESLYGDGGYYAREDPPIGPGGDFVTGSSLSPLFGRATARLLSALDGPLGGASDYLEAGFGTGAHLTAVADALGDTGTRRLLAWDRVSRPVPARVDRVAGLEGMAKGGIEGMIFSYELFDALPVHRLVGTGDDTPDELWVGLSDEDLFEWRGAALSDPSLASLVGGRLANGQIADLAPGWRPLYRALAERLGRGLIVTCDFGFERPRLLDDRVRHHGTLACYRGQRVHRDALRDPGRQDLAAHVDFTALVEEGERCGLETLLFARQAEWLGATGLFEELAEADLETRMQALRLLDLEGMGEEIRVLIQGREIGREWLLAAFPILAEGRDRGARRLP